MDRTKILLISLFSLVVIGIGFALYWLFFRPILAPDIPPLTVPSAEIPTLPSVGLPSIPSITVPTQPTPDIPVTPETIAFIPQADIKPQHLVLQQEARGGLTQVNTLTTNVQQPKIAGNNVYYYNSQTAAFEIITPTGDVQVISDDRFIQAETITWAPNAKKAVLEFPDGANIIYDLETNKSITLPKHWEDFSFSHSGQQLSFKSIGLDNDNKWLAIVNADGSGSRIIEPIGINADKIKANWSPNNQVIAFAHTGRALGFDREEIYLVGQNGENFPSLIVNGRGFIPLWAPQGDRLLFSIYSTRNDLKPELWVANAQGDAIGTAKTFLNTITYADKCTFKNSTTVICAVPLNLPAQAGAYRELSQESNDIVYEIDIINNTKRILAIPSTDVNVKQLMLSEDQKTLYLLDQVGAMLSINLP